MRVLWLAGALLVSACTTGPAAVASPAPGTATPTATAEPTAAPTESPTPAPTAAPAVPETTVTVAGGIFPIVPSFALKPVGTSDEVVAAVRFGVQDYLQQLDEYRRTRNPSAAWMLTGRFRDAVLKGLEESAEPGVQRTFAIETFKVEQSYGKPWGRLAFTDVVITILDRDVAGVRPDQRETGRLRLAGDRRLTVFDAWDFTNRRWFNGPTAVFPDALGKELAPTLGWYLRFESWIPGSPVETFVGPGGPAPYVTWRQGAVKALDRTRVVSRTFEGVSAKIERFDTFVDHPDGIATVLMSGTLVERDAAGATKRTAFERRVKAFRQTFGRASGGWIIADEQLANGGWATGGDLALFEVDQTFA